MTGTVYLSRKQIEGDLLYGLNQENYFGDGSGRTSYRTPRVLTPTLPMKMENNFEELRIDSGGEEGNKRGENIYTARLSQSGQYGCWSYPPKENFRDVVLLQRVAKVQMILSKLLSIYLSLSMF